MKPRRYKLFPKQKRGWALLEDPALRRILFDGGARSGKTDVILVWLIKEALSRPGARVLVARWRLDHARTTIWNLSLKKILPPGTCGARYHESTLEARFPNGSMIRVGGLDDAERVDKILGDEYLHIFINEATQVSWDTVTKVLTRLSQNIPGAARKLISTATPRGRCTGCTRWACRTSCPRARTRGSRSRFRTRRRGRGCHGRRTTTRTCRPTPSRRWRRSRA